MGGGADVNAAFGLTTMRIAISTGVKVFNQLVTMCRGRVSFPTLILWTPGFIIALTVSGVSEVELALRPANFVLHNSEFVAAHFRSVLDRH